MYCALEELVLAGDGGGSVDRGKGAKSFQPKGRQNETNACKTFRK